MAIDNLATQTAKASAAMILTIHVSPAFVTNGEGLKLSALLQCSQKPICMFAVFVSWYAEMKSCAQQCTGSRTQRTRPRNLAGNMVTSSNGNILRVTGLLCGEFTGPGEFPTQRPVTRSFDVFFDLRLKKRLSKQPWGWWFETPSWSLWRQCNEGNRPRHFSHDGYNRVAPIFDLPPCRSRPGAFDKNASPNDALYGVDTVRALEIRGEEGKFIWHRVWYILMFLCMDLAWQYYLIF